jgi:hypothetical protein
MIKPKKFHNSFQAHMVSLQVYNKSIHFSPLPATKLNEIHKKKKEF